MNKILIVAIVLLLSGCADTVSFNQAISVQPVGFFHGLWHGMIFPFAWLASLFMDSVSVYAIYNNGGWYDFGFAIGVSALSSSSSVRK